MARIGREAHVGRCDDRLKRGRLVTLAAASACLGLSIAVGWAMSASADRARAAEPLVSPQYQAKTADTGAKAGPNGPAADPSGGDADGVAAGSDPKGRWTELAGAAAPKPRTMPSAAAWYQAKNARYQLRQRTSLGITDLRNEISPSFLEWKRDSKIDPIVPQTDQEDVRAYGPKVISSGTRPSEQMADTRLLLRLGLGLGLAYLVFLVTWFWRTRNRTHGVTRVVRF